MTGFLLYACAMLPLGIFMFIQFHLSLLASRRLRSSERSEKKDINDISAPFLTVQLPIYNEPKVIVAFVKGSHFVGISLGSLGDTDFG